jgi:hypothetical protein
MKLIDEFSRILIARITPACWIRACLPAAEVHVDAREGGQRDRDRGCGWRPRSELDRSLGLDDPRQLRVEVDPLVDHDVVGVHEFLDQSARRRMENAIALRFGHLS